MERQTKRKKKLSKQEFFELKSGIQLSQEKAPNILGRGLQLKGSVENLESDGAIIAQGGDAQGFALIIHKNHLRFLTCVNGEITRVESKDPIRLSDFNFEVSMSKAGAVSILINDKLVGSGKVNTLSVMPIDGLSVGSDPGGSVGEYAPDYALKGNVILTLQLLPVKKNKKPKNNALAPINEDPNLPRVLIIGDSISIGYTLPVREILKGVANVHRPPVNCASTNHGVNGIEDWLGDKKWDVIHFNWGLHDLKYMGPNGENLANPELESSKQQVPINDYVTNLVRLVERLKETNAKLIWRNTTPVPNGAKGRVVGDSKKYNDAAQEVMSKYSIETNDLYNFAKNNWEKVGRKADVHFTNEGSKALAKLVAQSIKKKLENN